MTPTKTFLAFVLGSALAAFVLWLLGLFLQGDVLAIAGAASLSVLHAAVITYLALLHDGDADKVRRAVEQQRALPGELKKLMQETTPLVLTLAGVWIGLVARHPVLSAALYILLRLALYKPKGRGSTSLNAWMKMSLAIGIGVALGMAAGYGYSRLS